MSPAELDVYEIRNGAMCARICRYGASVMSLTVPDRSGVPRDVVLGFESPADYLEKNSPYFGCVVGRVANRICDARFSIDGQTYHLPANHGPNTLHGGPEGLHKRLWTAEEETRTESSVTFKTSSPDGDQGFPGDVEFSVVYSLPSSSELIIAMEGHALTQRTPISLAHHMYWNLGGHDSGTVLGHEMRIHASSYTPVGPTLIPTGDIVETEGTPFDFQSPTVIGSRIGAVPGGYDHNYVLHRGNYDLQPGSTKEVLGVPLHPVASASSPLSGISMTIHANTPGVQFYSGNFLDGSLTGKAGTSYQKHAGFCLETQGFPNAVNEPKFPSIIIAPGEVYRHAMHIQFSNQ